MKNLRFGYILFFLLSACLSSKALVTPLITISSKYETPLNQLPTGTPDQNGTLANSIQTSVPKSGNNSPARPTPYVELLYRLQPGSPKAMENFAHPEAGCNWMGVGGQVFDIEGNPVLNMIIKLAGTFNDGNIEMISLSGGALYLGPGGYEFKLADQPIESIQTLWLTLFDARGTSLSDPVVFSTFASCDQNFVLINFSQLKVIFNGRILFLPFVFSVGSP